MPGSANRIDNESGRRSRSFPSTSQEMHAWKLVGGLAGFHLMHTTETVDGIASVLRSIIGRDYGPCRRVDIGPLQVLAHTDTVGDDDHHRDGVVTVSGHGIVIWRLIEHDRGPCSIRRVPLDGLASFMSVVMWPRLVREWDEHRLMAESTWTGHERAAIDAWEFGKARLRRLIHRDHLKRMTSYPQLRDFYLAVHSRDALALRRYTGQLPGHVAQIDGPAIQTLAQAIEVDDRELALSQERFLVFRSASIAVMENGDYDIGSDEQDACLTQVSELRTTVLRVAQRRYAAQFLAFCLSQEMLAIRDRHFTGMPEGERAAYEERMSAFVIAKLETIDQLSFYQ